ncbi:GNAT family N-acetyltransferase [Gorillibacterium timonense]|uniref:GNAT family N-acetyltransferase n=1 Tax=Gorillibacterium timonense TaxID=1689269 RepID=UPI00071C6D5D|nr:GNAT family N-acetyltransferase [Gorillibacterium timonense]
MNGIHHVHPDDFEEFFRLSEFAFQYEVSDEDRRKKIEKLKPEELWGYYSEDKLAAKLMLLSLAVSIGDREFAMGGIASVSTWPEYRRGGFVAELLKHSFQVMREAGQILSMLAPFSFPFYRKFGYEIYTDVKTYELELNGIPALPDPGGAFLRTRDFSLLRKVYDSYAKAYSGMLVRTDEWWERIVGDRSSTFAVWLNDQGEPRAYLRYLVRSSEMKIHEWIYLDETARSALLKWISNHDSMCGKVTMKSPADDALSFLLPNPRFKQEAAPYFMARIVDAEAFIRRYPFRSGDTLELILQVEDEQAEWNVGCFKLTIGEDGSAEIVKLSDQAACQEPDDRALSCSIQTLTALLMGYQTPTALRKMGRLEGSEKAAVLLENRLPGLTPYLSDFF